MNLQNKELLESNLKYLGFGEQLNRSLQAGLSSGEPSFQLVTRIPHFSNVGEYVLDFRQGEQKDIYILENMHVSIDREIMIEPKVIAGIDTAELEKRINNFPTWPPTDNAALQAERKAQQEEHAYMILENIETLYKNKEGKETAEKLVAKYPENLRQLDKPERFAKSTAELKRKAVISRSFGIYKGRGISAKKAFNLLEDRAILQTFSGKNSARYQKYMKLDFNHKDENGNFKYLMYNKSDFNLEKILESYPIRELKDTEQKEYLIRSLQTGNRQQVTMEKGEELIRHYVESAPDYKDLTVYDQHMNKLDYSDAQKLRKEISQEVPGLILAKDKAQRQDDLNNNQQRSRRMGVS